MKKSGIFVTAAVLAAVSMSAQAAIKLNATRLGLITSIAPIFMVPLNDAGATTLAFNLPANKKLVLSYTAMCKANATLPGLVDIDIVVNTKVVVPTADLNDPLCNREEEFSMGSITVQIQGIAGRNTVQIFARPNGSVTSMTFGNSALLVFD